MWNLAINGLSKETPVFHSPTYGVTTYNKSMGYSRFLITGETSPVVVSAVFMAGGPEPQEVVV